MNKHVPNLLVLIVIPLCWYAVARFMLAGSMRIVNYTPSDYRPFALVWLFAVLLKLVAPNWRLSNHACAVATFLGCLAANEIALQQVMIVK